MQYRLQWHEALCPYLIMTYLIYCLLYLVIKIDLPPQFLHLVAILALLGEFLLFLNKLGNKGSIYLRESVIDQNSLASARVVEKVAGFHISMVDAILLQYQESLQQLIKVLSYLSHVKGSKKGNERLIGEVFDNDVYLLIS